MGRPADGEGGRVRLSPGGHEWPPGELARGEARQRFLVEVERLAPSVLDDLAGEPLTRYCDAWAAADLGAAWLHEADRTWALIEDLARGQPGGRDPVPQFVGLRAQLLHWAERHHLAETWLLDRAVDTVSLWYEFPERAEPGSRRWFGSNAPTGWGGIIVDQPLNDKQLGVGPFAWNPLVEQRAVARARIVESVDLHLNAIERLVELYGLVPTSGPREPTHFAWLVRYQVLGESYGVIGKAEYREAETVADGVKSAARLVGLRLRKPSLAGRPRKNRAPDSVS